MKKHAILFVRCRVCNLPSSVISKKEDVTLCLACNEKLKRVEQKLRLGSKGHEDWYERIDTRTYAERVIDVIKFISVHSS